MCSTARISSPTAGCGGLLASAGDDETVRLWHPATGRHLRTLTGHMSRIRNVAFAPDGRLLASASDDETVRLWNISTVHGTAV